MEKFIISTFNKGKRWLLIGGAILFLLLQVLVLVQLGFLG